MISNRQVYYYQESKTIENLRVILCFMILMIHVPLLVKNQEEIIFNNGIIYAIFILFKRGICSVAVPTFFFISGYLFFLNVDKFNKEAYLEKLKKRFYSLFIPYIAWCFIYVGYHYLSDPDHFLINIDKWGGVRILWDCNRFGEDCASNLNILGFHIHNCAPIDGPLWFIRDLLVVCLFSPLIFLIIKKLRRVGLILLAILMIFNIWIPIEGFSSTSFFFFSFGAFFSIYKSGFIELFRKALLMNLIISVILLIGIVLKYGNDWITYNLIFNMFTLTGSVTTIALVSYLPQIKNKIWNLIGESGFFVFASHFAIVQIVSVHLFRYLPETYSLLLYFTIPFIVLIIINLAYYGLKKIPYVMQCLNGGR